MWVRGEVRKGFWSGDAREIDHLEDPGVEGRMILEWIFRQWEREMDRIHLAQDRDRRRTLVIAALSHRDPSNAGNFLSN